MINKILAVTAVLALSVTGLTLSGSSAANAAGGGDNAEGQVVSVQALPGGFVEVKGYAFDYSQPSLAGQVSVRNTTSKRVTEPMADEPGYDLTPWGVVGNHGFTATVPAVVGANNTVCVTALNVWGKGNNKDLGCHVVYVPENASIPGLEKIRLAGSDRYSTAASISMLANRNSVIHTLYLVTGQNFPDALSAAPAAARPGHALLLTPGSHMTDAVVTEMKRLNPSKVILVGGPTTLTPNIVTLAKQHLPKATVSRIAGQNRYDTSILLAQHAFPNAAEAFVASGEKFADALSAAPTAALANAPVILVPSSGIPSETETWLRNANLAKVTVAGGTTTISAANYNRISTLTQSTMIRHDGVNRYETNVLLAKQGANDVRQSVIFASGQKFPDALAAAAASPKVGPLLLSTSGCIPQGTWDLVSGTYKPSRLFVTGGADTLSASVFNLGLCNS